MFRITLVVASLILAACAADESPSDSAGSAAFEVPSSCTFSQTISNPSFLGWGVASAKEYTCALYAKMDCKLYTSGDLAEIQCSEINPADLQGAPGGCVHDANKGSGYVGSWMHDFVTGGVLYSKNYDCPQISTLYCSYHLHPGDACNDSNGSALDDCDTGEDDAAHEDVRCVQR